MGRTGTQRPERSTDRELQHACLPVPSPSSPPPPTHARARMCDTPPPSSVETPASAVCSEQNEMCLKEFKWYSWPQICTNLVSRGATHTHTHTGVWIAAQIGGLSMHTEEKAREHSSLRIGVGHSDGIMHECMHPAALGGAGIVVVGGGGVLCQTGNQSSKAETGEGECGGQGGSWHKCAHPADKGDGVLHL